MPEPAAKAASAQIELRGVLDAELGRLPDRYRAVIVLCDLEGKTRKEAARQLGCPEGTAASLLARGRAMLARRLRRHGLGVAGGALAMLAETASAVPPSIVSCTITTIAAQAVPPSVALLAEGVIKAMLVTKLKAAFAVVLLFGFIATGASVLSHATPGQGNKLLVAAKPADLEEGQSDLPAGGPAKRETFTAWGKEVGGLQAGLGYLPGQKRLYRHGESVQLVVRVRNVGKNEVTFQYLRQFFIENPPTVKAAEGQAVFGVQLLGPQGEHVPVTVRLAPGKEVNLANLAFGLRPMSDGRGRGYSLSLYGTGKVSLQYEHVFGMSSSGRFDLDPTLSNLATGKLELQVQDAEKREDGTAWGKAAGGLQAGLQIRPAKRVYHHGETVRLFVRVRNVSKETVKFEYIRQFLDENPPTITDADGKNVTRIKLAMLGEHGPTEVSLEPGKDIVLESRLNGAAGLPYKLKPTLGTGKVSFQYEAVLGTSSSGFIKLDPKLNTLGTGKLEVQVTDGKDAEAWGKEVGGLLCRLRADKKGEFKLTVRDLGKRDVQMHAAQDGCEVEFDGTWFRWLGPVSILGGPWPAGRRYDDFEIPVSLGRRWQDSSGNPINLTPGKHTVRVAYVTLDRTPVRAVSNPVEIEVAAARKGDR
jgi:hypothetical protein